MARGPIPESSGSTLSGVPAVPGKIPSGMASRPTSAGQQSGVVSSISSFIPGQVVVLFITGGESLFTPAALGRWAFRWPENARRAITTAFA